MKKALLFAVLVLVIVMTCELSPAMAFNGYVMAGGGVCGTVEQSKAGGLRGYGKLDAAVPIYWAGHVCARGEFWQFNNSELNLDLESYSGTVMLLTRDITGDNANKINPYIFTSLNFLHNVPDSMAVEKNNWTFDGGGGFLATFFGLTGYLEAAYKKMPEGKDTFRLGTGLVFDLSKVVTGK